MDRVEIDTYAGLVLSFGNFEEGAKDTKHKMRHNFAGLENATRNIAGV